MSDDLPIPETPEDTPTLLRLSDEDRARLGEAVQELLAHGSILGLDAGRSALYHWCRQYFDWVKEAAALVGLDVALMHEERMVQAIPRTSALQIRLRQDATLVWLALWYAGDVRWRDEGQTQAFLSVAELNGLIKDQLLPDAAGLLTIKRMKEILRQAARFHLIRFEPAEPFEESGIEVLPAIRRVVPFRDLAAWTETAASFQKIDGPTEEPVIIEEEES
ncbi:MAG: DUF4194 domain-containing protein [Luteolibacter sp.]|uniref:DUF4194 domain-containing protein n=1 Tax=Luteolibacter sp. TaxID=1962973 RepID=UPI0032643BA7